MPAKRKGGLRKAAAVAVEETQDNAVDSTTNKKSEQEQSDEVTENNAIDKKSKVAATKRKQPTKQVKHDVAENSNTEVAPVIPEKRGRAGSSKKAATTENKKTELLKNKKEKEQLSEIAEKPIKGKRGGSKRGVANAPITAFENNEKERNEFAQEKFDESNHKINNDGDDKPPQAKRGRVNKKISAATAVETNSKKTESVDIEPQKGVKGKRVIGNAAIKTKATKKGKQEKVIEEITNGNVEKSEEISPEHFVSPTQNGSAEKKKKPARTAAAVKGGNFRSAGKKRISSSKTVKEENKQKDNDEEEAMTTDK